MPLSCPAFFIQCMALYFINALFVFHGTSSGPVDTGSKTCEADQFICYSYPFSCLPKIWVCDGEKDCSDGSDEKDCSIHMNILLIDRKSIKKIDVESSTYVTLISNLNFSIDIDYDYHDGTVFWVDNNDKAIKSAPIDSGSPITTIISSKMSRATNFIAVDWIYGNIYWTDEVQQTIEMADKKGEKRKTIVSNGLDLPRAIELNPLDGWMYWTDWGKHAKIEKAGLDGSKRTVIIDTDIVWPNGLALAIL